MNWKKWLFPPVWVLLLLTAASAAGLIWVFTTGIETSLWAIAIYVLAFYTLTVVCVFCVLVLPKTYKQLRKRIYSHPLGNRYLTDRIFRAKVSLYLSLGVNLLYALLNLLSWRLLGSWWFVCLCVYYCILSGMRFLLAGYIHRHNIENDVSEERRRARICGWILLLLNLFLTGAVLMILYQGKGFAYEGILIYVMALYTFYQTTHAIIDMVKYRNSQSPVLSTTKTVSLAAAAVSMLNLETAMFASFGADMAQKDKNLMIILTGAGVSVCVIGLSVRLILKYAKTPRKQKGVRYGK